MKLICKHSGREFDVTKEDLQFLEEVSPIFDGKKYLIPPPTLAPEMRLRRRLSFRNQRKLYRRSSSLSGKPIVSIFSPVCPFTVYDQDEWWGDHWDALHYGRPFNPAESFFDQLRALTIVVPHMSLYTTNVENSYYTNYALNLKNCYLLFGASNDEDCLYGDFIITCKDTVDGLSLYHCECCYEGVASQHCYNCQFFTNCRQCHDSFFIEDCDSCSNCALCFGLYRAEYHIMNEFVGKERYLEWKSRHFPLTEERLEKLASDFGTLKASLPHQHAHIYNSENCTGDAVYNSKNCHWCFDIEECEDCKFLYNSPKGIRSYDCNYNSPTGVECCYEVCSTLANSSMGTFLGWNLVNAYYCLECHSCRDVFGCVGLRNKQYCVLNVQYTRSEYEKLVSKIIQQMSKNKEWGEYLPPDLSYFGYNETVAYEYFPMTPEEAVQKGWSWRNEEDSIATNRSDPDVKYCKNCSTPYKIIPQEKKFYFGRGLPLPSLCPEDRHKQRVRRRNPRFLWERTCSESKVKILTTYAPSRPEVVWNSNVLRERRV